MITGRCGALSFAWTLEPVTMKHIKIAKMLDQAAYFRALADPDANHLIACAREGSTTMLPARALARAQYWEDRAAELLAEGLARKAARVGRRRGDGPKRAYVRKAVKVENL
jgi:hypothetical protein